MNMNIIIIHSRHHLILAWLNIPVWLSEMMLSRQNTGSEYHKSRTLDNKFVYSVVLFIVVVMYMLMILLLTYLVFIALWLECLTPSIPSVIFFLYFYFSSCANLSSCWEMRLGKEHMVRFTKVWTWIMETLLQLNKFPWRIFLRKISTSSWFENFIYLILFLYYSFPLYAWLLLLFTAFYSSWVLFCLSWLCIGWMH